MIYQKFSKRQELAMTWWNRPRFRDRDAIICDGSIRSGKTICMADGFLLWAMTTFQDQSFAICGKTIASLRRNVIRNLPSWIGGEFHITEQRSDNKLTVRCRRTGKVNTFYLFGGKDEASYALVQGITLAGALLDEVALMPRSFVEQVVARCSVEGSKMWFNCNPEGPEHWFYKEWVLKAQERNALHIHFTMEDNYSLSVKIKERYERMYTGVFYQRYIKGLWCVAEGLVYQLFDPKLHVVHTAPEVGRYFISVDYGTLNPFSAGLWCLRDGVATRIREYYHNGREANQLTDSEYYSHLEELAGKLPIEAVIVDPSAASFITEIRRHGRFPVRRARNDVLDGIRVTSALIQQGRVKIMDNCKDAIREFGLYRWDEKAPEDKVIKEFDHAMDDIRYFCFTIMRKLV